MEIFFLTSTAGKRHPQRIILILFFTIFFNLYPQPLRLYFWTDSFKYVCQVLFFMAKMRLVVIPILFTPIPYMPGQHIPKTSQALELVPSHFLFFGIRLTHPKCIWENNNWDCFFSFEILPTLEKYSSMFSFFSSWKCPSNFAIFPSFFNSVFW